MTPERLQVVRSIVAIVINAGITVGLVLAEVNVQETLFAVPGFSSSPLASTINALIVLALFGTVFGFMKTGYFGHFIARTFLLDELWIREEQKKGKDDKPTPARLAPEVCRRGNPKAIERGEEEGMIHDPEDPRHQICGGCGECLECSGSSGVEYEQPQPEFPGPTTEELASLSTDRRSRPVQAVAIRNHYLTGSWGS